jgi:hypothetical protein
VKKVGYLIFHAMITNYAKCNRKFKFSSFRAYQTCALKTGQAKDPKVSSITNILHTLGAKMSHAGLTYCIYQAMLKGVKLVTYQF